MVNYDVVVSDGWFEAWVKNTLWLTTRLKRLVVVQRTSLFQGDFRAGVQLTGGFLLRSVFFEQNAYNKHNTTSAIPHISLKQLRAMDVPVINASLESTLEHYSEIERSIICS